MKKPLIAISALFLSISLSGCQNVSSVAETSSSEASSFSSISDKEACIAALNKEHRFPSFSLNSIIASGGENLIVSSTKKEIDLTNNIEHIICYESKVQSLQDGNSSTVVTSTDVYKTSSATYTRGDNGLYTATDSSDAVFRQYSINFVFSSVSGWELTKQGYTSVLKAEISDISSFTGSDSYTDAEDMVAEAYLSTENVLTGLAITYTYKDSYSVSLTYSFSYLDVLLELPTV